MKMLEKQGAGDPWNYRKISAKTDPLLEHYSIDPGKLINATKDYTIGFLIDMRDDIRSDFQEACSLLNVSYRIFDIRDPLLYEKLRDPGCDGLIIRPYHDNNQTRNLFHEAAHLIHSEGILTIYPSIRELNIYEAKRSLSNFVVLNNILHPKTLIFYDLNSAREYIANAKYPLVFKSHLGASASGVEILNNKREALRLAKRLFNKYYLRRGESDIRAMDWGYMLLQDYIEDAREFRLIKIGDSWWGYEKWKNENQLFHSGSGVQKWNPPSELLLDFCNNIASEHDLNTICFDVFQDKNKNLMVNELQTWFGSIDPSEMLVNGIPGRYLKDSEGWRFDPGCFNICGSMVVTIADFISKLQKAAATEPSAS